MGREQSAYVVYGGVGLFMRSCGVAEYQFTAVVERSSDFYCQNLRLQYPDRLHQPPQSTLQH